MGAEPLIATDTRRQLLLTALRLYAEHGIQGVSLRTISSAAGSRNSAAMHYHFSNRQGVLVAAVEMIVAELQQIAKSAGTGHPATTLREGVRVSLEPVFQLPRHQPWGEDAIRFMSRLMMESDPELHGLASQYMGEFYARSDEALASALPQLSRQARQLRMMFMAVNVFHGIAEIQNLAATPLGDLSDIHRNQLQDELVDYLLGGLTAASHKEN